MLVMKYDFVQSTQHFHESSTAVARDLRERVLRCMDYTVASSNDMVSSTSKRESCNWIIMVLMVLS